MSEQTRALIIAGVALTPHEAGVIEDVLVMDDPYAGFTDRSFSEFFRGQGVDIDDPKLGERSDWYSNRLRAYLRSAPVPQVGLMLDALLERRLVEVAGVPDEPFVHDYREISARFGGGTVVKGHMPWDFIVYRWGVAAVSRALQSCGYSTLPEADPALGLCLATVQAFLEAQRGQAATDRPRIEVEQPENESAKPFGRWTLTEELGHGGYGTVWRGRRDDGVIGAVKILGVASDPEDEKRRRERFRRGPLALTRLDHPNIVKLLDPDIIEDGGRLGYVMALVEGCTLRSLGDRRTPLLSRPIDERLGWFREIADAIRHAHTLPDGAIYHRDLTPDNVLIDQTREPWRAVVVDFDLARDTVNTAGSLTRHVGVIGKDKYVPPEQKDVRHGVNPYEWDPPSACRRDLWSLGMTLQFLMSADDATTKKSRSSQRRNTGVPAEIAALIERMLFHDDPDERPATVDEVLRALTIPPDPLVPTARDDAAATIRERRASGKYDVFLCHNSADKPAVRALADRLLAAGILPWLDERELQPGVPWRPELERLIRVVRSAAVIVGGSGIGPWHDREISAFLDQAVRRELPVIPTLLPDAPSHDGLPLFLQGHTWVDFRTADPDPFHRLLWGITGNRQGLHQKVSTEIRDPAPRASLAGAERRLMFPGGEALTLVWVPGGEFWMGASREPGARNYDPAAYDDEAPVHRVRAPGFWIGQHPVTNAQYRAFAAATGRDLPEASREQGLDEDLQPATRVDWHHATAFCAWLSSVAAVPAALPSEALWERAARGDDGRRYPWGDEDPTPDRAVFAREPLAAIGGRPAGVGPYGAHDQAGNVWEWTSTTFALYTPTMSVDDKSLSRGDNGEELASDAAPRVVRGGSWPNGAKFLRAACRRTNRPGSRYVNLGFRVCVLPESGIEP